MDQQGAAETTVTLGFERTSDPSTQYNVARVAVTERLSGPYEATVDLFLFEPNLDTDVLFGADCRVSFERDALTRDVLGIVTRLKRSRDDHASTRREDRLFCQLVVAPAFWLLKQQSNSRIFSNMTVIEILVEVLTAGLETYGRTFDATKLTRSYPIREYTVQYQESDFDFLSRLMEQEGISYHFTHEGDYEEMVLTDANNQFTEHGQALTVRQAAAGRVNDEVITTFSLQSSLTPTAVAMRDFDWSNPDLLEQSLTVNSEGADALGRVREHFHYQRDLNIGVYDEGSFQYTVHDIGDQLTLRAQEQVVDGLVAYGDSHVTYLRAGLVIDVNHEHDGALSGKYLITEVTHGGQDAEGGMYANNFRCIPFDVPYRPRRITPRPRVHGVQTATVVGAGEEEIYTDEHGRIRVQFHWDRYKNADARMKQEPSSSPGDERASCWIRVAQIWGGAGWGFTFIPRVGMEVVVTFVDGDPDRPLVTGCVHNGTHAHPYEQGRFKTKSTIRTQSSPGGDGYHELTFEDQSGSEEIFLYSKRNLREIVDNDHTTHVHAIQRNTVDLDQFEHIGGNQDLKVMIDRTKFIQGNEHVTVLQDRTEAVQGHEMIAIDASRDVTIGNGQVGPGSDRLWVRGARDVTVEGIVTETFEQDHTLTVVGAQAFESQSKRETVHSTYDLEASTRFQVYQGQGVGLKLESSGASLAADKRIEIESREEISLTTGKSSIVMKKDGTIEISGDQIIVRGTSSVEVFGEGSAIVLDQDGIVEQALTHSTEATRSITRSAPSIQDN